ncbi:MAG: class F sortase [Acidimicrobiales bacterium]|nr:class F sortase [Acidimicrobiales bacterium]
MAYLIIAVALVATPPVSRPGGALQVVVRSAVTANPVDLAYESAPPSPVVQSIPRRPSADALVAPDDDSVPVRLSMPRIGISGPVRSVGIGDDQQLDVPFALSAGWYRHSAEPDAPGASVIAAHVDYGGRPGLFFELRNAAVGDAVSIETADGLIRQYVVTAIDLYDKSKLPSDELFRTSGEHALHLVTCGGTFDSIARSYRGNRVITAVRRDI